MDRPNTASAAAVTAPSVVSQPSSLTVNQRHDQIDAGCNMTHHGSSELIQDHKLLLVVKTITVPLYQQDVTPVRKHSVLSATPLCPLFGVVRDVFIMSPIFRTFFGGGGWGATA